MTSCDRGSRGDPRSIVRFPIERRSTVTTTVRRRITLFDIMSLIAATGIGLSLTQFGWPRQSANPAGPWSLSFFVLPNKPSGYPSKTWMLPVAERVAPILPCLASWTGAFLATRLHPPRPRRRRLVLQPGLVAAVAALSVLMLESALLIWTRPGSTGGSAGRARRGSPSSRANGVVLLAHHAGWAVAVSWLTLALIGRWRPEPSWVDRWGRALGCTLDRGRALGEPLDRSHSRGGGLSSSD